MITLYTTHSFFSTDHDEQMLTIITSFNLRYKWFQTWRRGYLNVRSFRCAWQGTLKKMSGEVNRFTLYILFIFITYGIL